MPIKTWRWREVGVLATLTLAMAPTLAAENGPDPARLSALVRQDCGSCHGLTLKGGLGKALTVEALAGWKRDQLVNIILDGVPGTPMPPWRALLTGPEARWIADALKQGTVQ